ncbi:hypothetical protein ACOSP7_021140 [Xanthoceras sorbifolium]
MGSQVEAIGTCYLTLSSGFVLELEKTFYVLSFSRKLISVSRLVPFGYSFNFLETSFSLFYKSDCVGNGTLSDDLYCINLQNNATYNSMHIFLRAWDCCLIHHAWFTGPKRCSRKKNRTLLDMVRSMLSSSNLLKSL